MNPSLSADEGSAHSDAAEFPILFYDGECALCNGAVRWLLPRLRSTSKLRFAPLEGRFHEQFVTADHLSRKEDALVLYRKGEILLAQRAVLGILPELKPLAGKTLSLVRVFPSSFQAWGYRAIARYRLRWFGNARHCPIPSAKHRFRFLP